MQPEDEAQFTAGRCHWVSEVIDMFRLITTPGRGSASDLAAAWVRYPIIEVLESAPLRSFSVFRLISHVTAFREIP